MKCAPIIIPTLCRFEHLKRCITSLSKNLLAKETELFIGLDYPCKEEHWIGYNQIKDFLATDISGFLKVNVIIHEENKGENKNTNLLKERVFKEYDCYIFTEDDNEFSPNFLEYMNFYLNKYETDLDIVAVAAYAYPIIYPREKCIYFQQLYFAAYGYGAWKDKELAFTKQITLFHFREMILDRKFIKSLRKNSKNQFCNLIKGMLGYGFDLIQNGNLRPVDISYGIEMFYQNKYMVFPTTSMVRNWGFDGTGVNCTGVVNIEEKEKKTHCQYNYELQDIENETSIIYENILEKAEETIVQKRLEEFFDIQRREYWRTVIAWNFIKVFGLKKMRKIITVWFK